MGKLTIRRSLIPLIDAPLVATEGGYTSGTLLGERKEVGAGTYAIPSGAYAIHITNTSALHPITVNGERVSTFGEWHKHTQFNKEKKIQDFVEAVTIVVPPGGKVWYKTIFPS